MRIHTAKIRGARSNTTRARRYKRKIKDKEPKINQLGAGTQTKKKRKMQTFARKYKLSKKLV